MSRRESDEEAQEDQPGTKPWPYQDPLGRNEGFASDPAAREVTFRIETDGRQETAHVVIPPEIPGRERYWLTHRNRIHKANCGYVRDQRLREWVAERGRAWEEINSEAERKGKVLWWCLKCYPQAHPAVRDGV